MATIAYKRDGKQNPGFVGDDGIELHNLQNGHNFDKKNRTVQSQYKICDDRKLPLALSLTIKTTEKQEVRPERQTWGNSMEFLFSCIAMSVGLGNVWRFPFTAYENGGGAFLIPYIIILFLVGKPCYYLEMIIGQFTSRSSVKMWAVAPALRGVGYAQMFSMVAVGTYYCSLMSITLYYLFGSFHAQLPWSECLEQWGPICIDSGNHGKLNVSFIGRRDLTGLKSSAELYFTKAVLKEKPNIDDGLGFPDWRLSLCLLLSWLCIFGVLARGVQSSGKAAYFLALFPYVIMIALLIRAVTLEGATTGILYFIRPNWSKLFQADVWYAAVTQCFFSLSVCFGGLITYSSYNEFRHNIYRDVIVVTSLDTLTSLMAGFTIFGILGNLAHELGTDDISNVVRGGFGLAFISYPDAIAKFTLFPQLFSVLFFLMLYVLGIGSGIALAGGIISIVNDQFPNWTHWHIVLVTSIVGFSFGTIYCTPGGQFVLGLVDYYAASFVVFILASMEVTGVFWLYGLENFLDDMEFMLGKRPTIYWRICWTLVTPLLLVSIFIYTVANRTPLTYGGIAYPDSAHAAGWTLLAFGILQVPFWYIYTIFTKRNLGIPEMFLLPLKPSKQWGPLHQANLTAWRHFKEIRRAQREKRISSRLHQFLYILVGCESRLN
ncbi:PREDICTED: sodium-dependent nutrient amino acid transporter 1-like [Ceratosolen solmsi marchali]|uniref:Transporter n=1 Tax=Ceratosolen solmsi marchali TaxID=326594 RepID=A0AAJ6YS29_9HYME|nr:PREDICTED: sodium-dependent nutrient amino acid transporter 1-like [Ceratosolen solmsi marchali]